MKVGPIGKKRRRKNYRAVASWRPTCVPVDPGGFDGLTPVGHQLFFSPSQLPRLLLLRRGCSRETKEVRVCYFAHSPSRLSFNAVLK